MARTIVLAHSPLLGPATWKKLAPVLETAGHRVLVPDLRPAFSSGPPYYERLAVLLGRAIQATGDSVTIVAHSGAGALVPAAVAHAGYPDAEVMYLDALLPHPGKSWFDTVPEEMASRLRGLAHDGLLPPWHAWWPAGTLEKLVPSEEDRSLQLREAMPLPIAYFEEAAPAHCGRIKCSYLRLSEGYEKECARAESFGWKTQRVALHHLAVLTNVEEIASAMDALSGLGG